MVFFLRLGLVLWSDDILSFATLLPRKRERAIFDLQPGFYVCICFLWLFLMVGCVGLRFENVKFPGHTHLFLLMHF